MGECDNVITKLRNETWLEKAIKLRMKLQVWPYIYIYKNMQVGWQGNSSSSSGSSVKGCEKEEEQEGEEGKGKGENKKKNGMRIGEREASVLRYKQKRLNRLFSKRIRYEVRKLNAEKRPRMKVYTYTYSITSYFLNSIHNHRYPCVYMHSIFLFLASKWFSCMYMQGRFVKRDWHVRKHNNVPSPNTIHSSFTSLLLPHFLVLLFWYAWGISSYKYCL